MQNGQFSIVRLKAGLDPVLSSHPPFRSAAWRATVMRPTDRRDFQATVGVDFTNQETAVRLRNSELVGRMCGP